MTTSRKSIHPDIPTDIAWQIGRRIYIRTSTKSQLGQWLKNNGVNWDRTTTPWGLWVGSTKKAILIPELLTHLERLDAIDREKAERTAIAIPYSRSDLRQIAKDAGGLWDKTSKCWLVDTETADRLRSIIAAEVAESVSIPYDASEITSRAKSLGAQWDPQSLVWRMSAEAAKIVRPMLSQWYADRHAADAEQIERCLPTAQDRYADIIDQCGRTVTDDAPTNVWGTDMIGSVGDIYIDGERAYVLVEVSGDIDDEQGYTPAYTIGVEVEPDQHDRRIMAVRSQMDDMRRERRHLAEQITEHGDAPSGSHVIDAEHLMSTQTIHGTGDWFCLTDTHVWYVRNNGMDGDDWARGNVRTGGAGGIGWRMDRSTPQGQHIASRVLGLHELHRMIRPQ